MRGRPGAAGRRGVSLLAILVSLLLIGLAAGLAIPAWYARHEVTLDNAALLLARDLREAQNRAAFLGITVRVEVDPDGWRAFDQEGRALTHFGGDDRIERRLSIDAVFEGVSVGSHELGPDDAMTYGPGGRAQEDGSIELVFRGQRRLVRVFAASGLISIEGLTRDWVDDGR